MTIDFDSLNVFQKFASYIPWFSTKTGNYSIIVQPAEKGKKADELSPEELKDEAIDGFIEFYLPEFYPFLYNEEQESGGYADTYQTIRSSISNNLEYVKKDGEALEHASEILKSDRDVVLEYVKKVGMNGKLFGSITNKELSEVLSGNPLVSWVQNRGRGYRAGNNSLLIN